MPLDDFRRQVSARQQPAFETLQGCADRYDVSLAAAILRWLRYTERRAMIVVSTDGFIKWAWSSTPALKTGRFIGTSCGPVALPPGSAVARQEFSVETKSGIDHPAGIWCNEAVRELSFYSDKYDQSYTLLHFQDSEWNADPVEGPAYDMVDYFENWSRL